MSERPSQWSDEELAAVIDDFQLSLPYRAAPYSGRAWGHPLHSLCSYQGKLKPAIAHWLIERFTERGDMVIDPLSGVGTITFEAARLGRRSIANPPAPFVAAAARIKTRAPPLADAEGSLSRLEERMAAVKLTA